MRPIIINNNNNKNNNNKIITNNINSKGIKYNNNKKQKNYQNSIIQKKNEILKNINQKFNQLYTPQCQHQKNFFNNNINQKYILPNKLLYNFNNSTENKSNKIIDNKNNTKINSVICDLSCIFISDDNIEKCYLNLISKLIKKNICCVQKSNKVIRCFKNGISCEIEIIKMEGTGNGETKMDKDNNVYCFKIAGKNGCNKDNLFKNIII